MVVSFVCSVSIVIFLLFIHVLQHVDGIHHQKSKSIEIDGWEWQTHNANQMNTFDIQTISSRSFDAIKNGKYEQNKSKTETGAKRNVKVKR